MYVCWGWTGLNLEEELIAEAEESPGKPSRVIESRNHGAGLARKAAKNLVVCVQVLWPVARQLLCSLQSVSALWLGAVPWLPQVWAMSYRPQPWLLYLCETRPAGV